MQGAAHMHEGPRRYAGAPRFALRLLGEGVLP